MLPRDTDVTTSTLPATDEGRMTCVFSRLGNRWSAHVMLSLKDGSRRFSDLQLTINGVSARMLTLTLRTLENEGLVSRTVSSVIPPRVDYALTDLGHSLRVHVEALGSWALDNGQQIEEMRRARRIVD